MHTITGTNATGATRRRDDGGSSLWEAARLARIPRPSASHIALSDHAKQRFAERIDAEIDPEVGLRLLLDEALAIPGRLYPQDGQVVRKHTLRDVTVVMSGDFGTVVTVYRSSSHPRRDRWQVPSTCAA